MLRNAKVCVTHYKLHGSSYAHPERRNNTKRCDRDKNYGSHCLLYAHDRAAEHSLSHGYTNRSTASLHLTISPEVSLRSPRCLPHSFITSSLVPCLQSIEPGTILAKFLH